ncbi:fibrobacter succinogenes major paralogous domain-containing protein [Litoribacter alkaliphilus]|uniref:Fibrobacter succinogenes major paralogous domain-containing protein n=1 Tax=Litoribacter ruber TaxID=702568 RepID=A0AAP2CL57_9BACT|nr:fibrobacter succinogenes major paralogous domain-containing protein [Litoribacter alkaliphilus]MBS9525266.1 fibrobacter succinogenes major paralogous domain-containing protein [Litoribacter alkaliphilus]
MKRVFIILIIVIVSCNPFEEEKPIGMVVLRGLNLNSFDHPSPNSRTTSSEWAHLFRAQETLEFQNLASGEISYLDFDPNNFSQAYQLQLPQGEYSFQLNADGEIWEDYLPFTINGQFVLGNEDNDIILEGDTDYALLTISAELAESVLIRNGDSNKELPLSADSKYFYQYVRSDQTIELEVTERYESSILSEQLEVQGNIHYHFTLSYPEAGNVNFLELIMRDFDYEDFGREVERPFNSIVRDVEGNVYKVVKIGNQIWMAENLRSSTFCNGDELRKKDRLPDRNPGDPFVQRDHSGPAYFHVDYNPDNDEPFGLLYNDWVVIDERGVCPCDWDIPTQEDWEELISFLGGEVEAGGKMKNSSGDYWLPPFSDGATNSSRFNAIGTGYFMEYPVDPFYQRSFYNVFETASWWSSTLGEPTSANEVQPVFVSMREQVTFSSSNLDEFFDYRSIRCIKKN